MWHIKATVVYYLKPASRMLLLCYIFFKANSVVQVLHQMQWNSNNWSIKRNTWLHLWQFKYKIFEITYNTILKNKKCINTKYKNKINKIQCWKYSWMNISIFALDKLHNDVNWLLFLLIFSIVLKRFTVCNKGLTRFSIYNKEFSCGNSKPCCESQITTH